MTIPFADLDLVTAACGSSLIVAVHTVMVRIGADGSRQTETGWAYGENTFDSNRWGFWFTYDICCDEASEVGCTLTQGYWKTHNEFARPRPLRIDWPEPLDELDTMCGETLLITLEEQPRGDAWTILAHQFIAAELNLASGASSTDEVNRVLEASNDLLLTMCGGVHASEGGAAITYAGVLDALNNGDIGPGHCE